MILVGHRDVTDGGNGRSGGRVHFFVCNHRSEERRMETVHDTLSNLFLKKIENTKKKIYINSVYILFFHRLVE